MESIWKQASKLKEQVSKQQQAVLKQYSGAGFGGSDTVNTEDVELKQHQKLEKLYVSIRAAKHLQRDIVRGVESYVVAGSKQVEIGNKLSDDSRRYGVENTCKSDRSLSKAASSFGRSRAQVEKDRRILLKSLEMQVAEPLRAMVVGAPLQDVRHLAQRYNRMRQETQAQTIEVSKRQAKVRESAGSAENVLKLEAAQAKLQELKSNTIALGREATAAMAAVEVQQQRLTLQQLITMVEAERNFHRRVLQILDQLKGEMSEHQGLKASTSAVENTMPSPPSYDDVNAAENTMPPPPSYDEVNGVFASQMCDGSTDGIEYFLGEAMYTFQAVSDVELNLSIGDYVVVRKLSNNGWAEGECKGKAGWFPFVYIERRERVLASKIA